MPLGKPARGRVADQVNEARGVLALQKFTQLSRACAFLVCIMGDGHEMV